MRHVKSTALLACTSAFLLACSSSLTTSAVAQTIQINRENKTIAISTTDEAASVADTAAISIGYETFAPDAATAQVNAGQLSHAIMDACTKSESKTRASRARISHSSAILSSIKKRPKINARKGFFGSISPGKFSPHQKTRPW